MIFDQEAQGRNVQSMASGGLLHKREFCTAASLGMAPPMIKGGEKIEQ
jgi:hypothetical protein